ncbi:hypothetical protein [Methylobacterium currus]|nr:hypothetical protein [Methylobacterium currus]
MPTTRKATKAPPILVVGWASSGRIITMHDPSPEVLKALEGMRK